MEIILEIKQKNSEVTFQNFIELIEKEEISKNFSFNMVVEPALSFREQILNHIYKFGFSSLFNFTLAQEDITTPDMQIDEIEDVIRKFICKLSGAKNLIIIDPYFFAASPKNDVSKLFSRLLSPIADNLEEICFVTNGKKLEAKTAILSVLNSKIKFHEVTTHEFHDRYWIDPDNHKGIVMGTSLNGIGNKIALIDSLKEFDVKDITTLVRKAGSPI